MAVYICRRRRTEVLSWPIEIGSKERQRRQLARSRRRLGVSRATKRWKPAGRHESRKERPRIYGAKRRTWPKTRKTRLLIECQTATIAKSGFFQGEDVGTPAGYSSGP